MDAVAIGSIAALVGSIIVFIVISIRVKRLIDTTNSKSED